MCENNENMVSYSVGHFSREYSYLHMYKHL